MAWARNQQIWLRLDQPHSTRMHCEIVDNHGEPLLMSNQELYSVMVQINCTLKTQALANMQVQWRFKSEGKWHPFQLEAILHCPTAEGHRAVPSSEQNWRLHACVAGGPSPPLEAVLENALQAGSPGTRGCCAVPLHAAQHTSMRKAICFTVDYTQGGVRQIGASDADNNSP